jgi:choline dehydrogenase-like flavoprotein
MHIDARSLDDNSLIEGDICIVGAGAAGISTALDWLGTSRKVILLESGGFEYEPEVQALNKGETSGQPYFPLQSARLRYFGGTTGLWGGMCSPFDPIDFEPRDYVPYSGWPITREELDPYYAQAQEVLQLGPYEYDLEYWQRELPNMTPFPLDEDVVWNKMWQYSTARFNKLYRDTIVNAPNVHLYTYATAVDIRTNTGVSAVREVVVKNRAGKTHRVRTKHFVLACGTIQNSRLLLASNTQARYGLGNDHDLVGRYFMEHLEIPSSEFWLFRPFPTDLYFWTHGKTPASAELALTATTQRKHRILNGTASLQPLAMGREQEPKMVSWRYDDPRASMDSMMQDWREAAAFAEQHNTGRIARAYQLNTRIEQAPNPDSRVTLGTEKDALGVPRAHLHWALTELDKRSIRTLHLILGRQIGQAGLGRVRLLDFLREADDDSWPETTGAGWHHMGTTRMHEDPRQGVVDANCRIHGLANLYVAGAACYATSGAPNPTLTLVALSLRLSAHLKRRLS